MLAERAARVTAIDGAPEMLEQAARSAPGANVRFERADLFSWRPARRYEAIFFGFFLSHVPEERFASFWAAVADAVAPGGRVIFVDDAVRSPEELVFGPESPVIMRRREGADGYRIVKMPHTSAGLAARLEQLGWSFAMRDHGPIFWGVGTQAAQTPFRSGRGRHRRGAAAPCRRRCFGVGLTVAVDDVDHRYARCRQRKRSVTRERPPPAPRGDDRRRLG
jgi:SAM-dependent methyltransferase